MTRMCLSDYRGEASENISEVENKKAPNGVGAQICKGVVHVWLTCRATIKTKRCLERFDCMNITFLTL
ncbi:hypothetical protein CBW55_17405 [Yersinia intermedia]|nr:hypothetical protein CBW55_17405 [Yersinia intermedia]OWF91797.1 hypothetical protein B4916_06700 [Yersinia intermedia]